MLCCRCGKSPVPLPGIFGQDLAGWLTRMNQKHTYGRATRSVPGAKRADTSRVGGTPEARLRRAMPQLSPAERRGLLRWPRRALQVRTALLRTLAIDSIRGRQRSPGTIARARRQGQEFAIDDLAIVPSKHEQGARGEITAFLLRPRRPRSPSPAVVALHQTTPMGKEEPAGLRGDPDMGYGAELARRGYVVLIPDLLLAGERVLEGSAWDMSAYPISEKPTLVGRHVLDTISCVSYLRSLPSVDPARIGLLGHSQGGIAAFLTSALDRRVAATVANDGFMTFRQDPNLARWSRLMPRAAGRPGFDLDEAAALVAPRALMLINNLGDEFIPHTRWSSVLEATVSRPPNARRPTPSSPNTSLTASAPETPARGFRAGALGE